MNPVIGASVIHPGQGQRDKINMNILLPDLRQDVFQVLSQRTDQRLSSNVDGIFQIMTPVG